MRTRATRERPSSTPILAIAVAVAVSFGCGPKLVTSSFKSRYQARTKIVAIAPMATLSTSREGAAAREAIRQAIFRELTRRRAKYTVIIQDIALTDSRIRDSGMSDSSATSLGGIDLCRITGANAVVKGTLTRYVEMASGGGFADAAAALFHTVNSEVQVDIAIFDGTDGQLVFRQSVKKDGDLVHSPNELFNDVASEVAKRFPYTN